MKILGLFDMYFLAMMLIQGTVVLAVDSKSFKKAGMDDASRKAHVLGWLAIIIAIVLFTLRLLIR